MSLPNSQPPTRNFTRKGRRWLFGGALFLFANGFFVARVEEATRPELAGVSAFFVLVLWAPAAYSLMQWLGFKRAALVLLALGAFAVGIETFAVKTGWPYGAFDYSDKIGVKYFGVTPWTVPFAWSPLVLGAMALAARRTHAARTRAVAALCVAATIFLLLFDGVLDPGAVNQKFWQYDAGGLYYGVPLSNFFGWILSGLIGAAIFYWGSGKRADVPLTLVSSVTLILAFWTSVCGFSGLWIPAALGAALLIWIGREIGRDKQL